MNQTLLEDVLASLPASNASTLDMNLSCKQAKEVLTSGYQYTMIAECIVASLAIPPNLILLIVIWRVSVFSANLRLLLAHFSFILLWFAVGDLIRAGNVLGSPDCGRPMTVMGCKIFDLACTGIALANIFYSFLGLCLYRLYACLRYRKYENTSSGCPWLGILLILLAWLIALVVNCSDVRYLPNDKYLPICASTFVPSQYSLIFYVYFAFELMAVALVMFVYFYTKFVARNMAINRAKFDLSARFQIDQSVRVNAVVIPSLILHILCHLPTFVLLTGLSGEFMITLETRPWFTRITYLLRLVYALLHPILAFQLNFNLKSQLLKMKMIRFIVGGDGNPAASPPHALAWPAAGRGSVVQSNQVHHFNVLDKIWLDKKDESTKKPQQQHNKALANRKKT